MRIHEGANGRSAYNQLFEFQEIFAYLIWRFAGLAFSLELPQVRSTLTPIFFLPYFHVGIRLCPWRAISALCPPCKLSYRFGTRCNLVRTSERSAPSLLNVVWLDRIGQFAILSLSLIPSTVCVVSGLSLSNRLGVVLEAKVFIKTESRNILRLLAFCSTKRISLNISAALTCANLGTVGRICPVSMILDQRDEPYLGSPSHINKLWPLCDSAYPPLAIFGGLFVNSSNCAKQAYRFM
jgi:hypothetical protein